ncbi:MULTISPECIES: CPBP family intramembrane glutamic endopeptidase [unclassified Lysinibacillus]|uniref:CPBP family intramembrane glutamic endopeptidase n=1 Tax=unclassified Lysinibacillus TaxID=2636778 RepID=UPI001C25E230|nr:CPBP family intramembrane glutamic endopeptidase [Lysinibacillus sp. CD3-6]UED81475.1 CPBP family intramembrane metalloprotease [Lysinibacillus sp. CD3-6]
MKKIILKIIGLEMLLIIFYVVNGAFVSIQQPSSPFLQFALLIPLAIGLFLYIAIKKKWRHYFFIGINKENIIVYSPLLIVLCIILIGTKGLNFASISDLLLMLLMQMFIVAFIEETIFRGILLRMLLPKGTFVAVWISSILFGITHALQLIGGQSIEDTIIQIIYALLVGLVLSLLIIDGQSIILTILFHGLNNFFNFMGNAESSMLTAYIIIFVLFVYMLVLWRRVKKKAAIQPLPTL